METLVESAGIPEVSYYIKQNPTWKQQRTEVGDSFLHLCVKFSHLDLLKFFISLDHPLDIINNQGNTPLHLACIENNLEILEYLLENHADPCIANSEGLFPLHCSIESNSFLVAKVLLSHNVSINSQTTEGETAVHLSIALNSLEVFEFLVKMHADFEIPDNTGNYPVHLVCRINNLPMLRILINKNVKLDVCNERNESPLSMSIRHLANECLYLLLETGVLIREYDIRLARSAGSPTVWQYISKIYKEQNHFSPKITEESVLATVKNNKSPGKFQKKMEKLLEDNEKLKKTVEELKKHGGIEEIDEIALLECIGRGEYGEVYKAKWRFTDVAAKKFYRIEDFNDEVNVLRNIRHPNIVLLMAICKNPPILVTEYMDQGNLSTFLSSPVVLSMNQLVKLALDVAKGLIFLHTASPPLLHRDLKSANCLIDSTFHVKICDFGLAQAKESTLKDTAAFGTFPYMAPEVITEQKYSVKSDIYAFGILLWEILHRARPFAELAPVQIVYQVVHVVSLT